MRINIHSLLLVLMLSVSTALAVAPKSIDYQGRLTSAAGQPVTDGVYTIRFRIYADSLTATPIWEETQPVSVKTGLFAVALGQTSSFPDSLFASANRFIGLRVNLDAELAPRQRLRSVPFALETAQWKSSAAGIGRSGNVGIGLQTPSHILDVYDGSGAFWAGRFGTNNTSASLLELWNQGVSRTWQIGIAGTNDAFGSSLPRNSFFIFQSPLGSIPLAIDSNGHVGINAGSDHTSSGASLFVRGRTPPGQIICDGIYAVGEGEASVGLYAYASSTSDDAGLFYGNVHISGTLSKTAGSFKIDHPLDPANKYLSHSFVESPDMMNIYNGNVTTDASGNATITMPDWFEALNRDFRYQLTVIGQFAQAIVASEIKDGRFTIKTDKPNVKVSWMVTGIRQDAYANAHRIPVEENKPAVEQGRYLFPQLFGQPEEKGVDWARRPELMKQLKAEREAVKNK